MRNKAKLSGIYKDEKSGTRMKYENKDDITGIKMKYEDKGWFIRNKDEISGTKMRYQEQSWNIRNTNEISGTIRRAFPSYNCKIPSEVHVEQLCSLKTQQIN